LNAKQRRPAIAGVEWAILCAIVLLAAWLRFNRIDQAEFLWDQAEISKCGLKMARSGRIAWVGTLSSTGLNFFMGAAWLMAIPHAITPSPIFATGFVAFINLLAVVGCYFLARHWFGRVAAVTATLLFAVSPWAVIYSRKVWHSNFLPPFVLLYVATGWLAFVRGRGWAAVAHALALAALVQLHFSAFPFAFLTVLWALIFRRRLNWRAALIGGVLAVLTFVPYFIVDAQRDWRNVQRFIEIMQKPSTVSVDALQNTWLITTGLGLYWLVGPDRYPEFVAGTLNVRWLFVATGVLVILGGGIALWRAVRRARGGLDDEAAAGLMLVTWLAVPALLLTRSSVPPAPHYFTSTFAAQFILIGWLVVWAERLAHPRGRIVQGVLIALVGVIAVAQVYEVTSVLQFVMAHDTPRGYGTPVGYEVQAVQTAQRLGQGIDSQEVILLSEGDEPGMFEMPAVADVIMYGEPHRAVDVRTTLVFPADPAIYWATYDETFGEDVLASLTPEVTDARIPLREGIRSFRFYRWLGGEPDLACVQPLPDGPVAWANGAQLVGYCLEGDPRPGGMVRWTLIWHITRTPTDDEDDVYYHWFNHLLDEEGQQRGQQDGASFHTEYWQAGDTVINWFDLQVPGDAPPGDYTMRVGMYTYVRSDVIENVPLVDADGEPAGEWVLIGPLQVK
jgi:4-amino-4-deoxy-L-arabinose transferase-like glycosyltransferase